MAGCLRNTQTPARRRRGRLAAHHGVLFPDAEAKGNLQVLRIAPVHPAVFNRADGAAVWTGNFTKRPLLALPSPTLAWRSHIGDRVSTVWRTGCPS